jgi:hypothetical protein
MRKLYMFITFFWMSDNVRWPFILKHVYSTLICKIFIEIRLGILGKVLHESCILWKTAGQIFKTDEKMSQKDNGKDSCLGFTKSIFRITNAQQCTLFLTLILLVHVHETFIIADFVLYICDIDRHSFIHWQKKGWSHWRWKLVMQGQQPLYHYIIISSHSLLSTFSFVGITLTHG